MSDAKEWDEACEAYHLGPLRGRFSHWCPQWDGLPIDETCDEFDVCSCFTPSVRPFDPLGSPQADAKK